MHAEAGKSFAEAIANIGNAFRPPSPPATTANDLIRELCKREDVLAETERKGHSDRILNTIGRQIYNVHEKLK